MIASVITLGCKVNEYESQSILNQLKQAGYDIKEGLVFADVYVVNTCAVTNMAERKSRQVLAKLNKLNSEAKIIVCGCAVQNNPGQFLTNENVLALVGNYGKHDIINFIERENKQLVDLDHGKYEDMMRPIETRTRQFIKIQDGCDYFCTYCVIPYVRGRSRSRDLSDIIEEIKNTKASEIVLTGINMSDYKIDGKLALKTLVKEVDKITGSKILTPPSYNGGVFVNYYQNSKDQISTNPVPKTDIQGTISTDNGENISTNINNGDITPVDNNPITKTTVNSFNKRIKLYTSNNFKTDSYYNDMEAAEKNEWVLNHEIVTYFYKDGKYAMMPQYYNIQQMFDNTELNTQTMFNYKPIINNNIDANNIDYITNTY